MVQSLGATATELRRQQVSFFIRGTEKRLGEESHQRFRGYGIYSPEEISEKEAKSSRNAFVLSFLMFLPLEF